jgi:hypothetical protein
MCKLARLYSEAFFGDCVIWVVARSTSKMCESPQGWGCLDVCIAAQRQLCFLLTSDWQIEAVVEAVRAFNQISSALARSWPYFELEVWSNETYCWSSEEGVALVSSDFGAALQYQYGTNLTLKPFGFCVTNKYNVDCYTYLTPTSYVLFAGLLIFWIFLASGWSLKQHHA